MNVVNVTQPGTVTPSVTKVGTTGESIPAAQGNSLPELGRASVRSESGQDVGQVAQQNNPPSQPNAEELQNLVEQANVTLQSRFSDLKFTVAEGTDVSVVRIEDSETGELIRQVPSEAMVAIARALDQAQRGMVLEEKA